MARDAAIVTGWGNAVPGREAKALEVFMEFLTFVGKLAAEGKCSEAEPFLATDASNGFAIIRGKFDDLMEIWASDDNVRLLSKAQLYVQDLKSHVYYTGEAVTDLTSMYAQILAEAGIS